MWIISPRGFYSAVQKPDDAAEGIVTVRARVKQDLLNLSDLLPDAKPYRVKGYSDYAWRIRVPREAWATVLSAMACEIDYANFKDEVKARQGRPRANVYMRVWSALHTLQQPERRRRESHLFDDDEFESWRVGGRRR